MHRRPGTRGYGVCSLFQGPRKGFGEEATHFNPCLNILSNKISIKFSNLEIGNPGVSVSRTQVCVMPCGVGLAWPREAHASFSVIPTSVLRGVGRAPMKTSLSLSQTRTSTHPCIHTSVYTRVHAHTCCRPQSCATLAPLHVFGDRGAHEARWPCRPSSWAQVGRMPIFKGCAASPAALPPRGHGPAPPPGGPGSSCAQSRPAAPRKLHDVTRPDRRKEQAHSHVGCRRNPGPRGLQSHSAGRTGSPRLGAP